MCLYLVASDLNSMKTILFIIHETLFYFSLIPLMLWEGTNFLPVLEKTNEEKIETQKLKEGLLLALDTFLWLLGIGGFNAQ